ncbi:MAG: hypothetical protein JWN85_245 [Gammaproteobacteria bacterium]|nr:hypothetical protein [Gammaproteobacteria bacterium]
MPLPDLNSILQLAPEELAPQLLATLKEKWPRPGERISLGFIVSNLDRAVGRCVAEAWSLLESGGLIAMDPEDNNIYWYFITRRGEAANTDADVNAALAMTSTRRDAWHPALRTTVYTKYVRGDYDGAALEAITLLEMEVRAAVAGEPKDTAVQLMRAALEPGTGKLTAATETSEEQQALLDLFLGASARFGASSSRSLVPFDADTCREVLGFISFLLRVVDARKPKRAAGSR